MFYFTQIKKRFTITLMLLFLILLDPCPFFAVTFTVDTFSDAIDANTADGTCATSGGDCSLRAAVMQANALSGNNLIELSAGTYLLSIIGTGEDATLSGDLDVMGSLRINGVGMDKTIIDAQGIDRVFHMLLEDTNLSLYDMTIQNGYIDTLGGGGAGILNDDAYQLLVNHVKLSSNSISGTETGDVGGGIKHNGRICLISYSILSDNSAQRGGAIFNSTDSLYISRSTISDNTAMSGAGISTNGPTTLVASTISGNNATSNGGAISNYGALTLYYCTLSNNTALPSFGAGIINDASVTFYYSILANSAGGGNCKNYTGTFTSGGYNLEDSDECNLTEASDLVNINPKLRPLGNYGGPTPTQALMGDSPAIDAGYTNTMYSTDQRDVKRPKGKEYDIGAFEWMAPNVPWMMYLLN